MPLPHPSMTITKCRRKENYSNHYHHYEMWGEKRTTVCREKRCRRGPSKLRYRRKRKFEDHPNNS